MGGGTVRVRKKRNPSTTGKCPKCGAFSGERCFNVDSGGRKAKAQDWTHPERLKANGFPPNAARTKPRKLGPRPDADGRAAARADAAARAKPKGLPWEYGAEQGPARRNTSNG